MTSLGIPLDDFNPSDLEGTHALFGPIGVGKSTQVAMAFPNCLYIQTQPDLLHFAYVLHAEDKTLIPKIPRHITLDEQSVYAYCDKTNALTPFLTAVTVILQRFILASRQGVMTDIDGLVWDEWSTLIARIYQEMRADPYGQYRGKSGRVDDFAVMRAFHAWHSTVLAAARQVRKYMVMVSHVGMPKWYDDATSHHYGQLKQPRGPKFPDGLGESMTKLCAECSSVVELIAESGPVGGGLLGLPGLPTPGLPAPGLSIPSTPSPPTPAPDPVLLLQSPLGQLMQAPAPSTPTAAAPPAATPPPPPPMTPTHVPRVFVTQLEATAFRKLRGKPRGKVEAVLGKFSYADLLREAGHRINPPVLPCWCRSKDCAKK